MYNLLLSTAILQYFKKLFKQKGLRFVTRIHTKLSWTFWNLWFFPSLSRGDIGKLKKYALHFILWLFACVSCHIQISKQWPFMHFLNGHHFVTSFKTDAIVFPVLVTKPQSIGRGKLHLFCKSYFCTRLHYPLLNATITWKCRSFWQKSYQLVRSWIYALF